MPCSFICFLFSNAETMLVYPPIVMEADEAMHKKAIARTMLVEKNGGPNRLMASASPVPSFLTRAVKLYGLPSLSNIVNEIKGR